MNPDAEDLSLDDEQQVAYNKTYKALRQAPLKFLAPVPSVVSLREHLPGAADTDEDQPITMVTPSRGHHELYRALEQLEGLEKEEQTMVERASLTASLTGVITNDAVTNPKVALHTLKVLGQAVPRRVCQHPFRRNDIVWVCRTCQSDETCVLCHSCFSQSSHEGHDVAFYHAQAGGCCDCGDPDAWDPAGFCPHHGPQAASAGNDASALPPLLIHRVRGAVPAAVDWMVENVAHNADRAYERACPPEENEEHLSRKGKAVDATGRRHRGTDLMDIDEDAGDNEDDQEEEDGNTHELTLRMERTQVQTHAMMGRQASVPRAVVFSPVAASLGREERQEYIHHAGEENALRLGREGSAGHGLYLLLHADDIHSTPQITDALRDFLGHSNFFSDTLLGKLVKSLRVHGQLVLWGNMEIMAELGYTNAHLWMDGDKRACALIGDKLLKRTKRLTQHGLFCSILTRDELVLEQRAVVIIQWLSAVAQSCDPLCKTVAECILPNRHLVPLLRADFKISARVTKAWYSLLLTLLAVPTFKSHLAAAYCNTYEDVTSKYARGMGVLERSGYTLSVQFLNRVSYVIDLVQNRDLLGKLGKSLLDTLLVARRSDDHRNRLNPNHHVLTHRRYSPCVSDLKCVLNVKGMPRIVASHGVTFLRDWIEALSQAQFMDEQIWRHWGSGHVEDESRGWVGAFNASISVGSLFDRLLGWEDDEESPLSSASVGVPQQHLLSCVELAFHVLVSGVAKWQQSEMTTYQPTPYTSVIEPHRRCPASLPFSTIAANQGTVMAMRQLPVSQVTPFSFHLPLHRFVAASLRELCLRKEDSTHGMAALLDLLRKRLGDSDYEALFRGLMEFPSLVLSRAAQVRAGLWRRNGPGLTDQVLNYAEPPFCRNMRDADLLMAQFSVLGRTKDLCSDERPESDVGMAFLVNLMLHRLGIFDFVGLAKASNCDITRYIDESNSGYYPKEANPMGVTEDDVTLPWTYSPAAGDPAVCVVLIEEFLHFIVMFISELPPVVPENREEQKKQAKFRLFREVVHRLAYGPKTHSELSEVHHVLSHWDNALLNEEGRLSSPDDATGAALGMVLADVADRMVSRNRLEPDKWVLRLPAWDSYDPAFFHISLRNHQTAAESRPKPKRRPDTVLGWEARPYAPKPVPAHTFFARLRRDATADATVLGLVYRLLHLHCRQSSDRDITSLRGKAAYEGKEKSETALARAVHILTLGAFAWRDAQKGDSKWREKGGGSVGGIFSDRSDDNAPTAANWVEDFLLADPAILLDDEWFVGEENALLLLKRLAVSGGVPGGFIAQDAAVRAGAAWLCDFASQRSTEASSLLGEGTKAASADNANGTPTESEIEKRKRLAKEKAMANMKAQALKFASLMQMDVEGGDSEEEVDESMLSNRSEGTDRNQPVRTPSFGSNMSTTSSVATCDGDAGNDGGAASHNRDTNQFESSTIPPRLLQTRPRCIICNDEESADTRQIDDKEEGDNQRRKMRRRTENALGFVGYAQASTVLKGGGGPPPDLDSPMSPVREFVGTHVALCGHAVHSECCESYLATVSHREDRAIGKRDEFRCPLCQRLSNCLVPFIDVGVDWLDAPTCVAVGEGDFKTEGSGAMDMDTDAPSKSTPLSLHKFLSSTSWWITRQNKTLVWDNQSAFIERSSSSSQEGTGDGTVRKPTRRIRSLKKRDLYAAWNTMMRTPRLVRRRLRPRAISSKEDRTISNTSLGSGPDASSMTSTGEEESAGETIVWRRFMDQISDLGYRADGKRLGDEHLHDIFGEFRHYVAEKYSYNEANRLAGSDPTDWPSCMFSETLSENRRQEFSREKLLSKLLVTIQSFTYSCCTEAFEARRCYRKSLSLSAGAARKQTDSTVESILTKFGIGGVECDGTLVVLPRSSSQEEDGSQPFQGRLGKLRYFGLATMAAAGAVAADLVQLVLSFPVQTADVPSRDQMMGETPNRAPIAYPLLFGNVLTHVAAAMCASCGRARAKSDSLDVVWPVPFFRKDSLSVLQDSPGDGEQSDSVAEDCEGFLSIGLLARVLQVLLGKLEIPQDGVFNSKETLGALRNMWKTMQDENSATHAKTWLSTCLRLLVVALSHQAEEPIFSSASCCPTLEQLEDASEVALAAASSFLSDAGVILQVLVPGAMARYGSRWNPHYDRDSVPATNHSTFEKLRCFFHLEPLEAMLESAVVREVVAHWFADACRHTKQATPNPSIPLQRQALLRRLYKTQGFRVYDWPSAGTFDCLDLKEVARDKDTDKAMVATEQPQDEAPSAGMLIESIPSPGVPTSTTDVLRAGSSARLVTFSSKKSASLLGGFRPEVNQSKTQLRPRVAVIPTSYTDLYAELGSLMPDCEQTAVCLVCGEVLNASGKGECTRHSYKCGAGAGMFFLLQECSGLIMHKSKAAYIHSPYVDSHGETPQYRGRPLNLDLDRYEHLREVWFSHGVRQLVVAERGSSRQVILPDFY